MTNGQKLALGSVVVLFVVSSLLWPPIMLFGIPAGVVGMLVGLAMYRAYRDDDTDGNRKRSVGGTVGGGAALILAMSVGGNLFAGRGHSAPARPSATSEPALPSTAKYTAEPAAPSASTARARIAKATEWCRGMYEDYAPDGSGFNECMKRRVPASDYRVVARDASISSDARRAEAMAKSVHYCEQFAHNPVLYGDCLKAEQELRRW